MKLLALDTATSKLVVGLERDGEYFRREHAADPAQRGRLPETVAEVLREAGMNARELDAVAVGIGPGSFAGLRSGMAFGRAMAWSLDLPLVGVDSLECIAAAYLGRQGVARVEVLLDARMQAVYRGSFAGPSDAPEPLQAILEQKLSDCAASLSAASQDVALLGNALALPELADVCADGWACVDASALPTAESLLAIARQRFERGGAGAPAALAPRYVRDRVALTRAQRDAGERL